MTPNDKRPMGYRPSVSRSARSRYHTPSDSVAGTIGRRGSNQRGVHDCVGYYASEAATEPEFDPGWGSTPCLICWQPLGGEAGANVGGNIRTINLLHENDDLSLFYRVHITCAEAWPDDLRRIDGSVMHGHRA